VALAVREAFFLAASGRPGPVLVDIPKDIQQQLAVPDWSQAHEAQTPTSRACPPRPSAPRSVRPQRPQVGGANALRCVGPCTFPHGASSHTVRHTRAGTVAGTVTGAVTGVVTGTVTEVVTENSDRNSDREQ